MIWVGHIAHMSKITNTRANQIVASNKMLKKQTMWEELIYAKNTYIHTYLSYFLI
jgi:hypothetical protein